MPMVPSVQEMPCQPLLPSFDPDLCQVASGLLHIGHRDLRKRKSHGEVAGMERSSRAVFELDGWMDGWMDGRTDGWMDGWIDREKARKREREIDR